VVPPIFRISFTADSLKRDNVANDSVSTEYSKVVSACACPEKFQSRFSSLKNCLQTLVSFSAF